MKRLALLAVLGLLTGPALAVQPNEMLPDPAEEARARAVSAGLRCLVCRNESIDDSNADLARDLRLLVRERIRAGDSNDQATEYIRARYGDFVLLKPPVKPTTWLLWFGPAALLLGAGGWIWWRGRRSITKPDPARTPLSAEEQAKLDALLAAEREKNR